MSPSHTRPFQRYHVFCSAQYASFPLNASTNLRAFPMSFRPWRIAGPGSRIDPRWGLRFFLARLGGSTSKCVAPHKHPLRRCGHVPLLVSLASSPAKSRLAQKMILPSR